MRQDIIVEEAVNTEIRQGDQLSMAFFNIVLKSGIRIRKIYTHQQPSMHCLP